MAAKKGIGSGSGTSAARTAGGNVSATARAATGSGKDKSCPLPDKQAAISAINLRHNGDSMTAPQVLTKVANSKFGNDPQVKAKIAAARNADTKKK